MAGLLTSTIVTRKALQILHNKLTFIGTINRQYDDSFAIEGGKIGSTLKIRLPNQYTVRTGQTASIQATNETSTTLTLATQKGVDVNFSSADLTLSLDDFTERILDPAGNVLAAAVEADAFNMYADVYNFVYQTDFVTDPSLMATWLSAKSLLYKNLTPHDTALVVNCNSAAANATISALSVLFNDGPSIAKQYRDGVMGHAMGFDFYDNEMVPTQTNGVATSFATGQVAGATQGANGTLNLQNFTNADILTKGTVFTMPGCYQCHPETKVAYSNLQQFVITGSVTFSGTTATVGISPSVITSGAYQNVTAYPTAGGTIVFMGASASAHPQNLAYHKNAFTFVTADLQMPKNMEMQAREVYDGVSMRFIRGFDILNDVFISRLDVLYGYLTIRAQMACRINGK